ncbi:MAG: EscE/YscE/SsaE family type III secretion system needle protein co-chaperone [Thiotrichales bacterium]
MSQVDGAYLNLEVQLKEDRQGALRDQIITELQEESRKVRSIINAGVSPDDYKRLSTVLIAFEKASHVVEQMWPRLQKLN